MKYIKKNRTIPQNQRHLWSNNHTWSASDVVDTQDLIWPATVHKIRYTQKIKHDPATPAPKSADQPTLGVQSTAETHENNKTALILGSIIVGSVCLDYLWDLLIHSLAAAYNNPATSTTRAHRLLPNQFTTLPVADSSQDTMDPITPGKAAAAFPARFASNLARLWSCFLTQSFLLLLMAVWAVLFRHQLLVLLLGL